MISLIGVDDCFRRSVPICEDDEVRAKSFLLISQGEASVGNEGFHLSLFVNSSGIPTRKYIRKFRTYLL
jgi:hypothetical protein